MCLEPKKIVPRPNNRGKYNSVLFSDGLQESGKNSFRGLVAIKRH